MITIVDKTTRGPKPGTGTPAVSMANAQAAWGADMPEWVRELAEACDRTSQAQIAKRLGYSGSVISTVLKRTYPGGYDIVASRVSGLLMAETVNCPVVGELKKNVCLDHQRAATNFASTSTLRVRFYRNCRGGCPHSRLKATTTPQGRRPGGNDVER